MSDAVNIMRRAASVEKAPLFEPYSKVIIHVGLSDSGDTEITYEAGNDSGRTLEINNEWGTQMMADTILAKIRGYQYQPLFASGALVDPSVELGDGITVNGIYSGIFVQATTFNSQMASDVSAPVDEEIEHEYGFESKTDRAYTRMVAQTRSGISLSAEEIAAEVTRATDAEGELSGRITVNAENITAEVTRATGAESTLSGRITVNAENITAEVTRATDAEGTLRSSISQNADDITAEVSRATNAEGTKLNHTYSSSSFGWQLTSTAFILKANNKQVFKADKNGITVTGSGEFSGKITATSGYIGNGSSGFTISNTAIYNGMQSLRDTSNNGVYVGTDGIAIGKGAFKVTYTGAVTATNLSITGGSIEIGNNFSVDLYGNLSANNATFKGTVYFQNGQSISSLSSANLYTGAYQASSNYGSWNGTTSTVNTNGQNWTNAYDSACVEGGYSYDGASYGYTSHSIFEHPDGEAYCTYLYTYYLKATQGINFSDASLALGDLYLKYGNSNYHAQWVETSGSINYSTTYKVADINGNEHWTGEFSNPPVSVSPGWVVGLRS